MAADCANFLPSTSKTGTCPHGISAIALFAHDQQNAQRILHTIFVFGPVFTFDPVVLEWDAGQMEEKASRLSPSAHVEVRQFVRVVGHYAGLDTTGERKCANANERKRMKSSSPCSLSSAHSAFAFCHLHHHSAFSAPCNCSV